MPLPALFDPLLNYLSSVLPPPLFSIVLTLVTHTWAFATSLFALILAMASSEPSTWEAQKLLPPLITLLCAYLALVTFFRTTGWIIRTGIWFLKWGTILSALAAGAGWVLGNAHANEGGLNRWREGNGVLPAFGGLILDALNGQGRNAAGGSRSRSNARSSSQKQKDPRPKAWESWDRQEQWTYEEARDRNAADGLGEEVQKILGGILGSAGNLVREGGWWEAAKGMMEGVGQDSERQQEEREGPGTRSRTKGKAGTR
ncbi:hypothetical protein CERSUDRAFT_83338 [Gelatoporia subvermispora B]|uniref:Uncharacterized protein n=1 Tax=Ceriporiopsis subvermispora (strain B) TaxID=914234 RepID=M2RFK1_CERS8|nr:hypothetical protein CERSUDRAFT_83338 [Gelatoporia subvermispora B]